MFSMRRREFFTLLGGASVAWPLAARAQQPARTVIGLLSATSPVPSEVAALSGGLAEGGLTAGKELMKKAHAAGRNVLVEVNDHHSILFEPNGLQSMLHETRVKRAARS
jgi:hypothetical protein